ncbi:MAG: transposase [Thermoguttaceae bacterium]|nr:transposase [Thermoguttaceae bacterium]
MDDGIEETLTFMEFPSEHWSRIRTNNMLERVNRELKRRTRAIGAFPNGQSALMLVCARLRHAAASEWGTKRYMNVDHLREMEVEQGEFTFE